MKALTKKTSPRLKWVTITSPKRGPSQGRLGGVAANPWTPRGTSQGGGPNGHEASKHHQRQKTNRKNQRRGGVGGTTTAHVTPAAPNLTREGARSAGGVDVASTCTRGRGGESKRRAGEAGSPREVAGSFNHSRFRRRREAPSGVSAFTVRRWRGKVVDRGRHRSPPCRV